MAVRICPECGGKVASTRTTCSHCGHEMDSTKICPECEESVDIRVQQCPSCGYDFDSAPMSNAPMKTVPEVEPAKQEIKSCKFALAFKKGITKEQFLREALLRITEATDSPIDIMKAKFDEVQEDEIQAFAALGYASGHYSASIGYDREERYVTQEDSYVSSGAQYTINGYPREGEGKIVKCDVEKTRIVTDWQPYNGNVEHEGSFEVLVEYAYSEWEYGIQRIATREEFRSGSMFVEIEETTALVDDMYDKGLDAIRKKARDHVKNSLPGDRAKDFVFSPSISDYSLVRWSIPIYRVYYEYNGKKYRVQGLAIDGFELIFEVPDDSFAPSMDDLEAEEKKSIGLIDSSFLAQQILSIALAVLGFFLGTIILGISTVVSIIGFCMIPVGIIGCIIISIVKNKKIEPVKAEFARRKANFEHIKGLLFIEKLAEYGLDGITDSEKTILSLNDVDVNTKDFDLDAALASLSNAKNTKDDAKNNNNAKKNKALIWLWISLGWTIFSYLVNVILSLCIGHRVYYMFQSPPFIVGFICMGIGIIGYIISLCFLLKEKGTIIPKIISLILMVALLCITFAPLVFHDPLSYEQISGGCAIVDCEENAVSVKIPSTYRGMKVRRIENYAFEYCSKLKSVTIPDSVTKIGYGAFYNCKSLESITIPDSVTEIGYGAFYNCTSLESITIPNSVTEIGDGAFYNCTSLESITLPLLCFGDYGNIGELFNGSGHLTVVIYGIENTLPCNFIPESIKTINITNGTVICDCAFTGCSSITSITIPNSVRSIGMYAFTNCTDLTSINYNGTKAEWNAISKEQHWDSLTGEYTVYCSDGTISK